MEQLKRQLHNNDQNKRQKLEVIINKTDDSIEKSRTYFENLSNELIYEIFEYFDYFSIYEIFSNLNQRFENLIKNSNLPIKINFSLISKSILKHYNNDIIQPNRYRINSIYFSNLFIYDPIFSSLYNFAEFIRLETLIINHNLEVEYVENLFNQLFSLSRLSSLVIFFSKSVKNKNSIYCQIFRLSRLKYCKLSFQGWTNDDILPYCTNEYSSIEHLSIVNEVCTDELNRLLSYVPQLHRLSLYSLSKSDNDHLITINASSLRFLTRMSLKLSTIQFDEFIQLFIDVFQTIEILHLTVEGYFIDGEYINANKWKDIILTYIPKLRIFDFVFNLSNTHLYNLDKIKNDSNQFISSFWIERQWFFTYEFYQSIYTNRFTFYSMNSSKNKFYTLSKYKQQQFDEINSVHQHYQSRLNLVKSIHIEDEEILMNCKDYFPHTNQLTFERHFSTTNISIVTNLNSIIPLKQLKTLVIECCYFSVQKLIKILIHTPNIYTLKLKSIPCYKQGHDYTSILQNQDFRLVSNMNRIKYVTCDSTCKLEQIKLLVNLCPRIEYLTINRRINTIESIVRFLLDRTNLNTRYLCLLCFTRSWNNWSYKLQQLIKSELLLDDYTLKQDYWNLYLWW